MPNDKFVYVTYIGAARERVWSALIEPEFTRQYWGHENLSDWKPGSSWEHREANPRHELKLVGKVVEFDAPRRLVLTWAAAPDAGNPAAHSRVTFELETVGGMVRLTVTPDQLGADEKMMEGIRQGWPRVLSSLKSWLETGKALDTWAGKR